LPTGSWQLGVSVPKRHRPPAPSGGGEASTARSLPSQPIQQPSATGSEAFADDHPWASSAASSALSFQNWSPARSVKNRPRPSPTLTSVALACGRHGRSIRGLSAPQQRFEALDTQAFRSRCFAGKLLDPQPPVNRRAASMRGTRWVCSGRLIGVLPAASGATSPRAGPITGPSKSRGNARRSLDVCRAGSRLVRGERAARTTDYQQRHELELGQGHAVTAREPLYGQRPAGDGLDRP
jgi:hypothetical protein